MSQSMTASQAAGALMLLVHLSVPAKALPSTLFVEDFDADAAANWTANSANGPTDAHADFFFDYGTVGIPAAPNSAGTTYGMKLQANLTDAVFGGFSVSPTGQSFTGDYVLTFDWWHNYIGADGGGVQASAIGATMLSTYGLQTSGTFSNSPGFADGVWFAATGDGGSAADFRAYSSERPVSYQLPPMEGSVEDLHATYHAGSRNNSAPLYADNFGGAAVPPAQTALFPETQFGTTAAGAMGFDWHEVAIASVAGVVTWRVDGVLLVTVDANELTIPTGGTNILFGHADINAGISTHPNFPHVEFTLIDNVRVTQIPEPCGLALVALAVLGRPLLGARRRRPLTGALRIHAENMRG